MQVDSAQVKYVMTRCSILSYATILRRRQYTQQCYNSDICCSHCNSDYHNYNWTDVNRHDTKVYLVIMLGNVLCLTSTSGPMDWILAPPLSAIAYKYTTGLMQYVTFFSL